MPKLIVNTGAGEREIPFAPGLAVREILDAAGVPIRSGCRGNGACGLCLVHIEAGDAGGATDNERLLLTPDQFGGSLRLACQARPESDLRVRIADAPSNRGRAEKAVPFDQPRLFDAFIKSVQYLVRLKTQQDVWDHLAKFIMTYFTADWTAFAQRDAAGVVSIHGCTLREGQDRRVLAEDVRVVTEDVLDSGFLASIVVPTPSPSMTAFLPIMEEYRTKKVMLIGHKGAGPLPNDLLDIYLALAGLAGATFERLQSEQELSLHRANLETLVRERTAELEAANRELEAFAYSVSHDLRAPLRAIDGFSRAIEEDHAHGLDEEGREYFGRMRAAAAKMGQLIDALLNLSRMTRVKMKRVPVDLSRMAQAFSEELRKTHPDRKAEFVIAGGVTVTGDPAMLHAAMDNLLENAWKFTAGRETARIEFGLAKDTETGVAVYFVRDNGAGFDMAYSNKLFCAFQRLHSTEDFPGMGIGLATVQRIINRHGGRIWAEGEPDKGATFYFTL